MISIHKVERNPQFLSTNRHLMQGYIDMAGAAQWDAEKNALKGISKVIGGTTYQLVLAVNGRRPDSVQAPGATAKIEPILGAEGPGVEGLVRITLESPKNADIPWTVNFHRPQ